MNDTCGIELLTARIEPAFSALAHNSAKNSARLPRFWNLERVGAKRTSASRSDTSFPAEFGIVFDAIRELMEGGLRLRR